MTLSTLIWGVTVVYAIVSIGKIVTHEWNDAILFGGYAIANLGALKIVPS